MEWRRGPALPAVQLTQLHYDTSPSDEVREALASIGRIRINGLEGVAWADGTTLFASGFQEFEGECCNRSRTIATNQG